MSVRSRVGALLVVLGSAGAITSLTQPVAWAAVSATSVFVSSEVTGCSSAIRRDQVDLQDDAWRAQAAASGLSVFRRLTLGPDVAAGATSTTVTSQPASFSFSGTGSSGSVDVSLRDLPVSGGTVGTPSATLPTVSVSASRQLQSCTSYPAGLYGTSTAATPFWNETGGTATTLNGVLFEFATPLRAFGAWFGDVESSPQSPGRVAFFDAAGGLLYQANLPGSSTCGGTPLPGDLCSDDSTRWIGFVANSGDEVAKMLVHVGGSSVCAGTPTSGCTGVLNSLSFIGATVAEAAPIVSTTTTTTTTTTTPTTIPETSTSTTTTTLPETTTTTTTLPETTTSTTTTSTTSSTSTTSKPPETTTSATTSTLPETTPSTTMTIPETSTTTLAPTTTVSTTGPVSSTHSIAVRNALPHEPVATSPDTLASSTTLSEEREPQALGAPSTRRSAIDSVPSAATVTAIAPTVPVSPSDGAVAVPADVEGLAFTGPFGSGWPVSAGLVGIGLALILLGRKGSHPQR